ncbi:hypothetical protein ACI6Q2_21765 [Chitinophagaceae bacterium LWZ2-11]
MKINKKYRGISFILLIISCFILVKGCAYINVSEEEADYKNAKCKCDSIQVYDRPMELKFYHYKKKDFENKMMIVIRDSVNNILDKKSDWIQLYDDSCSGWYNLQVNNSSKNKIEISFGNLKYIIDSVVLQPQPVRSGIWKPSYNSCMVERVRINNKIIISDRGVIIYKDSL